MKDKRSVMDLKAEVAILDAELIMLSKAFKLFAVAFAKEAPGVVEPALHSFMQSIAADLTDIAKKFPEGITTSHPAAIFARRIQGLVAEAREDIAKATKPH
jgi:hypothetical protein